MKADASIRLTPRARYAVTRESSRVPAGQAVNQIRAPRGAGGVGQLASDRVQAALDVVQRQATGAVEGEEAGAAGCAHELHRRNAGGHGPGHVGEAGAVLLAEAAVAEPFGVDRRKQRVDRITATLGRGADAAAEGDAEARGRSLCAVRAADDPHGIIRAVQRGKNAGGTEFRSVFGGNQTPECDGHCSFRRSQPAPAGATMVRNGKEA